MNQERQSLKQRARSALKARLRSVSPRLRTIHLLTIAISCALAATALIIMGRILDTYALNSRYNDTYERCEKAVDNLQAASDYLTTQSRLYVDTSDREYLDAYLAELTVRDRRGTAIETLREIAMDQSAIQTLESAVDYSDELAELEQYAMSLIVQANDLTPVPTSLRKVELSEEDAALSNVEKRALAHSMMRGDEYNGLKLLINERIQKCSSILMGNLRSSVDESNHQLDALMMGMGVSVALLLLMVALVVACTSLFVLWPMTLHEQRIRRDEPLVPIGACELRYLAQAYNEMYNHRHERTEQLQKQAETDPLTGVLNRGAYESLLDKHVHDMTLILIDVDHFKHFNDEYGHDMGDAVLIEVAATLHHSFRTSDFVCRIGGDEFAVIMTQADSSLKDVVRNKIGSVAQFLSTDENGIPPVTISVGVAFADEVGGGGEDLFRAADQALYHIKRGGRNGLAFHGETDAQAGIDTKA